MILDSFSQIDRYQGFHHNIYLGLQHLATLPRSLALGSYTLSDCIKVYVSEYQTCLENKFEFEAHRYAIDIQYPLIGRERVQWSPLAGMAACSEYDPAGDRTWYRNPTHVGECIIGDGVFAIYFPEDAHNPQLSAGPSTEIIKKVTLKISV
ncbi:MAG: YhcH/YjgK/YiaL family protein [Hahellaceae bacterium]|nr:YhcH/YjgK/YiaL family protein [Hahellaceae bacterium]